MAEEIWRPVVGYEGFYEVSASGVVRSLERSGNYKGRWGRADVVFSARTMKQSKTPAGYHYVVARIRAVIKIAKTEQRRPWWKLW